MTFWSIPHIATCIPVSYRDLDASRDEPEEMLHSGDKYIVFKSQLWKLFERCPVCTAACDIKESIVGTFLTIQQTCSNRRCQHNTEPNQWTNQPKTPGIAVGNLLLSAAILFAGASTTKVLRVLQFMNVAAI